MRFFVCIPFIIWYFIAKTSVAAEFKSLIYNYEKRTLIQLPKNLLNVKCKSWITSCPAIDSDERNFETEYSLYNKALFLRNIYKSNDECTELDKAVCDKFFEMSMAYSDESEKFEFGYEVFHKKATLDKISPLAFKKCYPMKKFDSSQMAISWYAAIKAEIVTRTFQSLNLRGDQMKFLWIPLVLVKLRGTKFQNVEYEIRKNNINPQRTCNNYNLGKEVMNSDDVDSLYSEARQTLLLEKVTLPSLKKDSDPDEVLEGECTPKYKCLTRWPLLPTDQFQFLPNIPLTCSNVTTTPIWSSTLELIMKKLDKYLYALYRITGQPLRVLAGVNGVLALPRSRKSDLDIVLKKKKTITEIETPRIIYKMVSFKLNPCFMKNCWYGILIVIHNGPYPPIKDKDFVCRDQSGNVGWEEIQYETWSHEGARSKFIYTCKITPETMKSVGLTYKNDKNKTYKPLSLLRFPLFHEKKRVDFQILKKKLFDEMIRLSKPDAEMINLDDDLIERPTIYDNFGSTDGEDFVYPSDKEIESEDDETDLNAQTPENEKN